MNKDDKEIYSDLGYIEILNESPYGILRIEISDGSIIYANSVFLKIIGYSFNQLCNYTISDIIHPDDYEFLLTNSPEKKANFRFYHKNGNLKLLSGKIVHSRKINAKTITTLWLRDTTLSMPAETLIEEFKELYLSHIKKKSDDKTDFIVETIATNLRKVFNTFIEIPSLFTKQTYKSGGADLAIPKEKFEKDTVQLIIGKYDEHLGPIDVYSSVELEFKSLKKPILNDAFFSKDKNIAFLPYKNFFTQVYKIQIPDKTSRGEHQDYALIFIKNKGHPFIPLADFENIRSKFESLDHDLILKNNQQMFNDFFNTIKQEIIPLNPDYILFNQKISQMEDSYKNMLKDLKQNQKELSEEEILQYVRSILMSFNEVVEALYNLLYFPVGLNQNEN